MFYSTKKSNKDSVQRVYLLDIRFENGMQCVKVGKASGSSSLDRMLQIQRDYFNKYRSTFLCRISRDRAVPLDKVFSYETKLHQFFNEFRYQPKTAFTGSTELFAIPIEDAIVALEYLLDNGLDSLDSYKYELPVYEEEEELPF